MQLDLSVAAELVWLSKGEIATAKSFNVLDLDFAHSSKARLQGTLHELIIYTGKTSRDDDKRPWVLAGGFILGPDSLLKAWAGLCAVNELKAEDGGQPN